MRQINAREFKQILNRNGFEYVRCKGDHMTYKNGDRMIVFNNVRLKAVVVNRLIKENNLTI